MHDTAVPGSGRCYKYPLPAQINACLLVCARSLILLKCVAMQISSIALRAHGVAVVVDALVAAAVGEEFVYCGKVPPATRTGLQQTTVDRPLGRSSSSRHAQDIHRKQSSQPHTL